VAGVLALLGLLGGCGVAHTDVRGQDRAACESLVADLPTHVAGHRLVKRLPDVPGATWGDPAIVLRCGVGKPAGYDPITGCQTANGLDWYVPENGMNDQSVDVVMTTIGRDPAVEVTLPAAYRPPVAAMVDLAPAIKAHTRETTPCG
jgi:hypothetical protein